MDLDNLPIVHHKKWFLLLRSRLMIVRRLPDSELELYHHGIMGMHWGVRRFQNKDGTLTSAGRKRRGLVEQIKYNRKMKKVRRAKVDKAKAQQIAKEEKTERLKKLNAERKERAEVIKTGDAKAIQKFQSKMSNKEYEKALERIDLNKRLNEAVASQSKAKSDKAKARLETVMSVAKTAGDIADSASKVYAALEKVGVVKKSETTSALDKKIASLEKTVKVEQAKANISKAKADVFKYDTYVQSKGEKNSVSNSDIEEIKRLIKELKDN